MENYSAIVSATILCLIVVYYFSLWKNYFLKRGIPHQRPWLLLGNMASVVFRKNLFVEQMVNIYNLNKSAKYVGYYDFTVPVIMIRDLELIKNIAVKNFNNFVDHRNFVDVEQEPLFAQNLFSLTGDKWRSTRNVLTPVFTSSKMKAMFKLMSKCAQTFSISLHEQCGNETVQLNSKDIFTRYTNDVIATCAFGIAVDSMKDPNNEFYLLGKRATNFEGIRSLKVFISRSFPKLGRLFNIKVFDEDVADFFHNLVRETIEMRKTQGIHRPDLIQLMMEAKGDKNDPDSTGLSIESMTAQAFGFFTGGFDSTAALMCFTAHHLAAYPEIQKKLQIEIDQVMANCNGEPTYEEINKMEYLDAIINETLRLFPIAPFIDRICTKSFELPPPLPGGEPVMLKPGDNVWFALWAIHRDPQYFPNPEKFDPERFLGDAKPDFNSNAYMPFGLGPRMCIGNRFAVLEIKVLFLYLLTKFHITLGEKMILPLRLSRSTFAITADGGFWLNFKPKNKPN